MFSSRSWRLRALVVAVLVFGAVLAAPGDPARAGNDGCGDVAVVFARGSGQRLTGREAATFLAALSTRLGKSVRATAYELGSASYGGARYPAVGVGVDSGDAFANLLDAGAYWSGNEGHRYRASVASGAIELRAYLEQRVRTCPTERLVLGGYSQGAQVVGDTLPRLSRGLRDRITFVGLFGDPKLSLPEGRGIFPAGCRGRSLSPWRRGNVSCYTDNGVLDARRPYVPADLAARTGSWCDRNDPICNSNPADFLRSTHGRYAQPGRAVDQAAREAATAVRRALGERGRGIDVAVGHLTPRPEARSAPAETATAATTPGPSGSDAPDPDASPDSGASPDPGAPSGAPSAPGTPSASPGTASPEPAPRGRPAAALVIDEYWSSPGAPLTFDASASAVPPSAIATYRWDFDGNGTTDRTTTVPTVDHTYRTPFTGQVRLRLDAEDGAELLTGARVHVDRVGLARRLPDGPASVTVRASGSDGAAVRWTPGAGPGRVDAWRIHDADGRLLAHVPGTARRVGLASLPDRTTALTVEAVNGYGSSAPEVAAPRGAGSSRFGIAPARNDSGTGSDGNGSDGSRADESVADGRRAVRVTEPRLAPGLVVTATTLLVAVGGALAILHLRTGSGGASGSLRRGGRHRRPRRP